MGTSWSLKAYAAPEVAGEALRAAIEANFAHCIALFSTWEPSSFIRAFNRAPAGARLAAEKDFLFVLREALRMADITDGAFDPGLLAEVNRRGFGPGGDLQSGPPRAWAAIALDETGVTQPGGVALDLSAIAKGFAVDCMAAAAAEAGCAALLAEIGGEFVGAGVKPDGAPFWVAIEDTMGAASPFRVAMCGLALASSGDLWRRAGADGATHIVRAESARNLHGDLACVSVIADSCMNADAWATALYAAGDEQGERLADAHGIAALFQYRDAPPRWSRALIPMLED